MVYGKWYPSWFGARGAAGGADFISGVGAAGTVAKIDLRLLCPPHLNKADFETLNTEA